MGDANQSKKLPQPTGSSQSIQAVSAPSSSMDITKGKSALKVPSAGLSTSPSRKDLKVRISHEPSLILNKPDEHEDDDHGGMTREEIEESKLALAKPQVSEKHPSSTSQSRRSSFEPPPGSPSHESLDGGDSNRSSEHRQMSGNLESESSARLRARRPTVAPPGFRSNHKAVQDHDDEDERRQSLGDDTEEHGSHHHFDLDLNLAPKKVPSGESGEEETEEGNLVADAELVEDQEAAKVSKLPLFMRSTTDKMGKKSKKALKKLDKMMHIVITQLGGEQSPVPTRWVAIWGAGLGLGTPKAAIIDFFSPPPAEVRMYVNKPFCAAKWASRREAALALEGMNGQELLPLQPVYMAFLFDEPPKEDRSILKAFERPWPAGLTVVPDFISDLEEEALLTALLPQNFMRGTASGMDSFKRDILTDVAKAQREKEGLRDRVQHFGYEYRDEKNDLDLENPLKEKVPDFMIPFIIRMMTHSILFRKPDQMTLTHFLPGQGIPRHVDAHSFFQSPIVILSLCGATVMDLRDAGEKVSVHVPRRSLLILDEEARLLWTHAVSNRTYDIVEDYNYGGLTAEHREERVSLTFRLLNRRRVCECQYAHMCDSQKPKLLEVQAEELERDLIHKAYEGIAPNLAGHTPWPKVQEFIRSLAPGQTMLDVGCGGGTFFSLTDYIYQAGTEISRVKVLVETGKTDTSMDGSGLGFNYLKLPFEDESFDAIICIAVLHHFSSKERRLDALQEILRVLTIGGQALLYGWAKNQRLKEVKAKSLRQQALKAGRDADAKEKICLYPLRNYSFLPIQDHSDDFRTSEVMTWLNSDKDDKTEHRVYHVFQRDELEGLLHELETPPRITDSFYDMENWCVRAVKRDPERYQCQVANKVRTICDDM